MKKKIIKGAGLFDVLKDPIGTIKESFRAIPSKLNNISTKTLQQYGQFPITQNMTIARTPLNSAMTGALNVLSFGQWNNIHSPYHAKMYHVALIIGIPAGPKIIVEKNEVINIAPFTNSDVDEYTEYFEINFPHQLTLDQIIRNAQARMGDTNFYSYNAIGGTSGVRNNCQDFLVAILSANGLMTAPAKDFLYQDITGMEADIMGSNAKFMPVAIKKITDLGSTVSRLIGKGKNCPIKIDEDFVKFAWFIKKNGMRLI